MFNILRKEINWGGRKLVLESGRIARQADGAVLATYGETVVLCTAVAQKQPKPGIDFFPLTVNYQEKTFAAGKIPGGFFKREGRPTEKEVLTSRLIDRPIRPLLFAAGFRNETQVICTVLSHDLENDPDVVALIGASAALTISGIPFLGPIAAARVGYAEGKYILNPLQENLPDSALDLVVAGTGGGVLMVESEAKELSEEIMLAVRRHLRLRAVPARHPGHHQASGRALRQGALNSAGRGAGGRDRGQATLRKSPRAICVPPITRPPLARTEKVAAVKAKAAETLVAGPAGRAGGQEVQGRWSRRSCAARSWNRPAHRRARHQDRASDRMPDRRPAAGPWLGPLHPGRDPGARGHDAGHR
jgi:polyribonucleotide nucleotidyltransferase